MVLVVAVRDKVVVHQVLQGAKKITIIDAWHVNILGGGLRAGADRKKGKRKVEEQYDLPCHGELRQGCFGARVPSLARFCFNIQYHAVPPHPDRGEVETAEEAAPSPKASQEEGNDNDCCVERWTFHCNAFSPAIG